MSHSPLGTPKRFQDNFRLQKYIDLWKRFVRNIQPWPNIQSTPKKLNTAFYENCNLNRATSYLSKQDISRTITDVDIVHRSNLQLTRFLHQKMAKKFKRLLYLSTRNYSNEPKNDSLFRKKFHKKLVTYRLINNYDEMFFP